MDKIKAILILLFLFIPNTLAGGITIQPGVKFNDGTFNYTVISPITDININQTTTLIDLFFDGARFCDYKHRTRFVTSRYCPPIIIPPSSGGGGGSESARYKSGNINETCIKLGGYLVMDENGMPKCIIPGENKTLTLDQIPIVEKADKYIKTLAEKLYPQNPYAAQLFLIISLIGVLLFLSRMLKYAQKSLNPFAEETTLLGEGILIAIIVALVFFYNWVRININMTNIKDIGFELWPSFEIGGWILTITALLTTIWLVYSISKKIGGKKNDKKTDKTDFEVF